MRLEFVCDLALSYRELPRFDAQFLLIRPFGSEEGRGYGEGDGTVAGPRLTGHVRWVNHPHRRSDGTMLPDTHGVIVTDDGATLLFDLQGRTAFVGDQGQQLLYLLVETEAERYRWLNNALCVVEGVIENQQIRARVFACINELV
jgi:hypothetical protein